MSSAARVAKRQPHNSRTAPRRGTPEVRHSPAFLHGGSHWCKQQEGTTEKSRLRPAFSSIEQMSAPLREPVCGDHEADLRGWKPVRELSLRSRPLLLAHEPLVRQL